MKTLSSLFIVGILLLGSVAPAEASVMHGRLRENTQRMPALPRVSARVLKKQIRKTWKKTPATTVKGF